MIQPLVHHNPFDPCLQTSLTAVECVDVFENFYKSLAHDISSIGLISRITQRNADGIVVKLPVQLLLRPALIAFAIFNQLVNIVCGGEDS